MELDTKHYALLKLISEFKVVDGRTTLQKLMFLMQKQQDSKEYFSYEPYLHGPFSRDLSETTAVLIQINLIEEIPPSDGKKTYSYKLTNFGDRTLEDMPKNEQIDKSIDELVKITKNMKTQNELISYVYKNYPKESGIQ